MTGKPSRGRLPLKQMQERWWHFFPEDSWYFQSTLQTFLLVPSSDCGAAAQLNVTAVTLRAVGYASVSWACECDGEAKVQPAMSHRLWSRMVYPTGDHMCSLNQEGETVVVEANSWWLVWPEFFSSSSFTSVKCPSRWGQLYWRQRHPQDKITQCLTCQIKMNKQNMSKSSSFHSKSHDYNMEMVTRYISVVARFLIRWGTIFCIRSMEFSQIVFCEIFGLERLC